MTVSFKRESFSEHLGKHLLVSEKRPPPSRGCLDRTWKWIKETNGYTRTVAGLGFLATGLGAIVFKALNYRKWNDQPAACTALAITIGAATHGAIEFFSKLHTRRVIRQIYKDYSLPVFWWFSQFFLITTTVADDWHEGFKITILVNGGLLFASQMFEAIGKFTGGADALNDTQFAKATLIARKGTLIIESVKVGAGGGLVAASYFTATPYPHFFLYAGLFLLSSPAGIGARLGFKKLTQYRKAQHGPNELESCDVKVLTVVGNVSKDWWPVLMGAGVAAGALTPLSTTSVACFWGAVGACFFADTQAEKEEFENIPISGPNPYSQCAQNAQWWIHRALALGGGAYVIALMATNPWPNQLVLFGYAFGAFGKYGLIYYAERDYDPIKSSFLKRYVRFNTHHRTLVPTIFFYLIESHMNTGKDAVVSYYEAGNWAEISAATLSWTSYGSIFVSPIPGRSLPPAVIAEMVRFLLKAFGNIL